MGRLFCSSARRGLLSRLHSHVTQMTEVSFNSTQGRTVFVVRQLKFCSCLTNDLCDFRIMNVINGREHVVLNLEVQPPCVPRYQPIFRGEIRRSLHLVFNVCDVLNFLFSREFSFINHVCQLEGDG